MNKGLSFYVFDNLRFGAPGMPNSCNIYRYETLEGAVKHYGELPEKWTSAIGCSIAGLYEVDLIHKINNEHVRVNDFYRLDNFKDREDVHSAMAKLEETLLVKYQYLSGLFPSSSVLCPVEPADHCYSEAKNMVLAPANGSKNLLSAINELYVDGRGWMTRDNFYETYGHANYYLDPTRPVVERINVNYREKEKPYLNQRDVSPICFLQMLEAAKEIEREKTSHLDEQIQAANVEAEQENSEKDTGKESVSLDDFSRDIS